MDKTYTIEFPVDEVDGRALAMTYTQSDLLHLCAEGFKYGEHRWLSQVRISGNTSGYDACGHLAHGGCLTIVDNEGQKYTLILGDLTRNIGFWLEEDKEVSYLLPDKEGNESKYKLSGVFGEDAGRLFSMSSSAGFCMNRKGG